MRAFRAIPALILTVLTFVSCGGKEDAIDDSGITIGDGIGTHAVSLEIQIAEELKRHIADGADPKQSYLIEYHLAADNIKTARSIVAWGNENGFTPNFDEATVVKGEWIDVDLIKESKLEVNPLWRDIKGVTSLAEKLMCEYEGWGFSDTP
jgi:regulator of RNase E activity RraB